MISAKEARKKIIYQMGLTKTIEKIEHEIICAVAENKFRVSIEFDKDIDHKGLEILCLELKGEGYRVEYIPVGPRSCRPLFPNTHCAYLYISWV